MSNVASRAYRTGSGSDLMNITADATLPGALGGDGRGRRGVGVLRRDDLDALAGSAPATFADTAADELVVVTTMRERKREMEERSDAFLTLPGGIGTMEEMFEMWTSASLGFHHKPVVLYDPIGFYRPLLDWVGGLAEAGLVKPEAFTSLVVCDDLDTALDACGGRR